MVAAHRTLTIELLGTARLIGDGGREVVVTSRKAFGLIAYLVAHPDMPHKREKLVSLLWGDRFDQQARQSLRQSLYALRRILVGYGVDALEITGDAVGLRADLVDCDLWRFRALAESGEEADLREAARLYRGEFMSGFSVQADGFEQWLSLEREQLKDSAYSVFHRLAKALKARASHEEALEAARRLVEFDPLRERTHRLIMRIHAEKGDRAAALKHYHRCAETLRRELDVEPDIPTLRLYEEIKAHALPGTSIAVPGEDEETVPSASGAPSSGVDPAHPGREHGFFSPQRPAVAVLPFDDLGGDERQGYFARAITSDITLALSYWRWFPVIGQQSAGRFRASGSGIAEAAQDLDARYVVTGTVRRGGDRVRITVQLIDAITGHHLWASRYDSALEELFSVQDEITERIVTAVEPELLRAEHERAFRKRPADLTAWDYVMRADWAKAKLTAERTAEAIELLKMAIGIDPHLSLAWSHLSQCHWANGIFGWAEDAARAFAESDEAARQALALDEADWLAHTMLGLCDMWNRHDYDLSIERLRRAVELNPSASLAHHAVGCSLEFSGLPEEAIRHFRTVMRLDPHYANNPSLLADFALCYLQLEQFEDALTYARKAIAMRPDYARGYPRLAAALGHLGRRDEASTVLGQLRRLQPGFCEALVRSTYPFREQRHLEILLEGLRKAGMGEVEAQAASG